MKERLVFLDNAKMIGIYFMIMGHCCLVKDVPYLYNAIYLFHMPLFFIISGYLFKQRGIKESIGKYAKAYLIPYLTMSVMTTIVVFAVCYWLKYDFYTEIITLFKAMCFGHGIFGKALPAIGVGWFLCSMFQALVLYNIVTNLFDERGKVIVVAMLFVLGWASTQFIWIPFSTQSALCSTIFLLIGEKIREYGLFETKIKYSPIIALGGAVIVLLAIMFSSLSLGSCRFGKPILSISACLICCYFVLFVSKRVNLRWGSYTLLFMAGNQLVSYANYKYQMGTIFKQISDNLYVDFFVEFIVNLIITFAFAYMFSLISWMKGSKK